jgi:ABC-2 type transport system permease protein
MAFVTGLAFEQFAAVSRMRWRTFVNSMRTSRGRGELAATLLSLLLLLCVSIGPAIGIAFGAAAAVEKNSPALLAALLWVVFLVWQLFPAISLSMTEGFDTSSLLRYPMNLATFGAIWITSGALEPSTVVCTVWLVGTAIGIGVTSPALLPIAVFTLLLFALANLLLSRLLMAWLDRLLAKRRTREIVGIAVVLFSLGMQALGQLSYKFVGVFRALRPYIALITRIQDWTPPGAVARAVIDGSHAEVVLRSTFVLSGYLVAFALLLGVRLRAVYGGELISEGVHGKDKIVRANASHAGIEHLGFSNEVSAVYEKELRTIFRSGQLILTLLVMPLFLMLVFSRGGRAHLTGTAFGAGAAYCILLLTQLSYNQFGVEQGGVQLYYVIPVHWRQISVGKNLAHTTILLLQIALLFMGLTIVGTIPDTGILVLTLLSVSFAAIANFAAGNLLSFYFPKKVDYARMSRRQASTAAGLAALGVQILIFGITVPLFFAVQRFFNLWIGVAIFVLLNIAAAWLYSDVLRRVDSIAIRKQDELIGELSKAA